MIGYRRWSETAGSIIPRYSRCNQSTDAGILCKSGLFFSVARPSLATRSRRSLLLEALGLAQLTEAIEPNDHSKTSRRRHSAEAIT